MMAGARIPTLYLILELTALGWCPRAKVAAPYRGAAVFAFAYDMGSSRTGLIAKRQEEVPPEVWGAVCDDGALQLDLF